MSEARACPRCNSEPALSQVATACVFGDPARCAAACSAGSPESCSNLGAHFGASALGSRATHEQRASITAIACDAHAAVGCVNLARLHPESATTDPPEPIASSSPPLPVQSSSSPPATYRSPAMRTLDDHALRARTLALVTGLRGLVAISRRDKNALADGKRLTYAIRAREVDDYITAQYRRVRVDAVLYRRELVERVGDGDVNSLGLVDTAAREGRPRKGPPTLFGRWRRRSSSDKRRADEKFRPGRSARSRQPLCVVRPLPWLSSSPWSRFTSARAATARTASRRARSSRARAAPGRLRAAST